MVVALILACTPEPTTGAPPPTVPPSHEFDPRADVSADGFYSIEVAEVVQSSQGTRSRSQVIELFLNESTATLCVESRGSDLEVGIRNGYRGTFTRDGTDIVLHFDQRRPNCLPTEDAAIEPIGVGCTLGSFDGSAALMCPAADVLGGEPSSTIDDIGTPIVVIGSPGLRATRELAQEQNPRDVPWRYSD